VPSAVRQSCTHHAVTSTATNSMYPFYQESFFMDKYSLSLIFVFWGLIRFRICAMVVVICSLVMPALRDLNFCTRSFVVIGLRIKYRRTASSVMPSLLALQQFLQQVTLLAMHSAVTATANLSVSVSRLHADIVSK